MTTEGPDWAALYQEHRDAMFRVALSVLRSSGQIDLAQDAVQAAMVSLMSSPPKNVENWAAVLVMTAKRRALDMVQSAFVARKVEFEEDRHRDGYPDDGFEILERLEKVERVRRIIVRYEGQDRHVLTEYLVKDRPRADIADELGVSPARVSQIATKIRNELEAALQEGG